MRFSTIIYAAGLLATAVKAQEDQGTTGSMTIQTETELSVTTATETTIDTVTSTTSSTSEVVSGTNEPTPAELERDACLAKCKYLDACDTTRFAGLTTIQALLMTTTAASSALTSPTP